MQGWLQFCVVIWVTYADASDAGADAALEGGRGLGA
jgi:hypothetical protein